MRLCDLEGKRVALWGFGREGGALLRAIRRKLPRQVLTILEEKELSSDRLASLKDDGYATLRTCPVNEAVLSEFEIVFISPGISIYRPDIQAAKRQGVLFTTHTNLWFAEHPDAVTICITGTKGKSTTSALTAHLLNSLGFPTALGGNIGKPLFDISDENFNYWVIELSSYQIATFEVRPTVALLLNLYPEHLDWHGSQEQYFNDKLKLLSLNHGGTNILGNQASSVAKSIIAPLSFGTNDTIHSVGRDIFDGHLKLFSADALPLLGNHNLLNLCAALTILKSLSIDPRQCAKHLSSFKPLPHRLNVIGKANGVTFVNDSISTVPEATIAALDALPRSPITLLVGGYDRKRELDSLAGELVKGNVVNVVTMGESGKRLARSLHVLKQENKTAVPAVYEASSLKDAVQIARSVTKDPGTILLSPASPSFGEFRDFEERGRVFEELFRERKTT